jgi:hypothetical protein
LAGRATEQLAGRARGSLAPAGGPPPRRHGCQAPQALSTGTRWGGPARARWAWWPRRCGCGRAFVSVSVSSASVRCPVSGAGVQQHACLSRRPLCGVRCGRLSVQMSGVRCPAWVSGVRGFPRPLCPAGGGEGWRRGRQPHGWDGRRRRGRLPCPRPVGRRPSRSLAVEAGPGLLGQGRGRLGLGRRSWAVVGQWLGRPRGRPGWAGWARGSPVGGEPGCAARRRLRWVVIVCGPGPSRLVAASLLGWTATCACGRGAAAACSERRLLDADDALTCEVGGGGEGI